MTNRRLQAAIIVLSATILLAACGGNRRAQELAYVERPAETIYNEAYENLERRRFEQAALLFDEVERQHPYSEWARRAMMMAAFASYERRDYEAAIQTLERYIALYPGSQTTSYAYYMIALSYYEQIVDVGRDQATTQRALDALTQVVRRYPDTDYARDSRLKIDLTLDHLAGKEMNVGRWYLRQDHYLAAINRFRSVVENYDTTSHVPEALHRLVEAYVALGIMEEASQVAAVLGHNFPGNEWYEDSYELLADQGVIVSQTGEVGENAEAPRRSWWGRTVGRVF